jgi:hypothetical protein
VHAGSNPTLFTNNKQMTKPKKKPGRPKGKTKDQFTITTRIELIQKFGVDKLRELANNLFETL